MSSPFGPRAGGPHPGIDLRGPIGAPVVAVASGKVIESRFSPNDPDYWRWGMPPPDGWPKGMKWPRVWGFGNIIKVAHDDGSVSVYAHLATRCVYVGEMVSAGQQIGTVGSTGYSSGPHLHFELRVDGKPVDPLPLLPVPPKA